MIDSQVFKEPKMVTDAAGSLSTPFLQGLGAGHQEGGAGRDQRGTGGDALGPPP